MALFFGLQSLEAYAIFGWFAQLWRDSGYSAATAGILAGVVAGMSIPLSLWLPNVLARTLDPRRVLFPVIAAYPVGFLGLMFAPHSLAVLWAVTIGTAAVTFPLILTLIGLRARTAEGTAALSAFTQSTGYLVAAAGPFLVGVVHDATGGWTWPLIVLLALALPLFPLAAYVSRPVMVEDQMATPAATEPGSASRPPSRLGRTFVRRRSNVRPRTRWGLWSAGARAGDPWCGGRMPYVINTGRRVDELVSAAVYLIDTEGIGALSLRRLAAAARLSPSTLLNHLDSKERIVDLVTKRVGDGLVWTVRAGRGPRRADRRRARRGAPPPRPRVARARGAGPRRRRPARRGRPHRSRPAPRARPRRGASRARRRRP